MALHRHTARVLVFKAHRRLYLSTLGLRVIKQKKGARTQSWPAATKAAHSVRAEGRGGGHESDGSHCPVTCSHPP